MRGGNRIDWTPERRKRHSQLWTPERRAAQAERIRQIQPWKIHVLPKTPEATERRNKGPYKHGAYTKEAKGERALLKALLGSQPPVDPG